MRYLLNAMPMAIIPPEGCVLVFAPLAPEEVPHDFCSAVGHKDTAAVISSLTGRPCPYGRIEVPQMKRGDQNVIAAYQGPRLPEGCTQLPEGATLTFYLVTCLALSELATDMICDLV